MADEAEADDVALDTASAETQQDEINVDEIDPEIADEIAGAGRRMKTTASSMSLSSASRSIRSPKPEERRGIHARRLHQKDPGRFRPGQSTRHARKPDRGTLQGDGRGTGATLRTQRRGQAAGGICQAHPEDWAAHRRANPIETEDHWTQFQLLKDRKAALEGKVGEFERRGPTPRSKNLPSASRQPPNSGRRTSPASARSRSIRSSRMRASRA